MKNVKVLKNDTYVDIDANKEYEIASIDFILEDGGGGANMFMEDEIVPGPVIFDYEILISYIADTLKGQLKDKYSIADGRINVI